MSTLKKGSRVRIMAEDLRGKVGVVVCQSLVKDRYIVDTKERSPLPEDNGKWLVTCWTFDRSELRLIKPKRRKAKA